MAIAGFCDTRVACEVGVAIGQAFGPIYWVPAPLARNMNRSLASRIHIATVALDLRNLSSEDTASEQQRRTFI